MSDEKSSEMDDQKTERDEEQSDDEVHFIEDLEERKNASGPVTTLAVGEEDGGGW